MSSQTISIDKAKSMIRSKDELYDILTRNRYYLPSPKCQLVTVDYLMEVMQGNVWVPKFPDIRLLPCPKPPIRKYILEELLIAMSKHSTYKDFDLGFDED